MFVVEELWKSILELSSSGGNCNEIVEEEGVGPTRGWRENKQTG